MTTEWNADLYHRLSDPQFAWGMAVLGRVALTGDETVIDAGCGTGRLSAELAARVPRGCVLGLDRSRQMALAARQVAIERGLANLRVVVADLTSLPAVARADLVFSTATFHWVLDHPRLFRELHAALVPGGRLVAQCGGAGNLARVIARAHTLMARREWAPWFTDWTPFWEFATAQTASARLAEAGFTDIDAWLEPQPVAFPDGDAFATFTATVALRIHLLRLPDERRRRRFMSQLTAMCAADATPFELDYVRLNLAARKPVSP